MRGQIPQSRADPEGNPETPPVGREIRRGPEAGTDGLCSVFATQSGHSFSGCIECFQFSVLMAPCCVSAVMLEPAFRAVSRSHTVVYYTI